MIRGIISPTNGRDAARDFGQVGRHHLGVDGGQDQACRNPARRADGPEQIGPLIACVARRTGSGATPGPDPGQGSLLPHARVRRENSSPDCFLARLTPGTRPRQVCRARPAESPPLPPHRSFLKASWASGSVFGCCGRDLQPAIPQCRQTGADRAPVHLDPESRGNPACQIAPPPAHHPVAPGVRPGPDRRSRVPPSAQAQGAERVPPSSGSKAPPDLGVIAMHPVGGETVARKVS